ncbi:nucleotidyltransferase family protein [uncultured Acinetobacter sp.]|uniref:nucleotidyltransferase family protein n=1 Tax=uncultured Acinetobacter sp. TaxID=165433 RepID=UPI002588B291|nr:nucleotidyltransferase family protein [uncultured Acinetobacter sp.]
MALTIENFIKISMENPINAEIISKLHTLGLDQCMLTAGSLFQTMWNHQSKLPLTWGIKDYDVFYFDEDLSFEAENKIINSAHKLFKDLNVNIESKNQARVHLWYSKRFGGQYPKLKSTKDGIDRYLISGTCIGLDIETYHIYAPNGLLDTEQGVLRINPKNYKLDLFYQKAKSYQERWPWLTIIEPDSSST